MMPAETASFRNAITAVVCTRDRPAGAARAIRSILANDHPDFRVLVVDQSSGRETRAALAPLLDDSRLIYRYSKTRGLAAARNLAVRESLTEFIAFTDDDCEVAEDWLRNTATALDRDSRVALVFGTAIAGKHDARAGFVPAYHSQNEVTVRSIHDKPNIEGIGACMGLRRSAWKLLYGFDEYLGAGARFRSAEETDFTLRALQAGWHVSETPSMTVVHYGFRDWREGQQLIHNHLFGIGAVYAKHLKCRRWAVLHVLVSLGRRWLFGRPVVDFAHTPSRRLRLVAFLRGFMAGLNTPVQRSSGLFTGASLQNR